MNTSRRQFLKSLALYPVGGVAGAAGIGESLAHTEDFETRIEEWWKDGRAVLNKRETRRDKVMALYRAGFSEAQIAAKLDVHPATVRNDKRACWKEGRRRYVSLDEMSLSELRELRGSVVETNKFGAMIKEYLNFRQNGDL